jgi:hypothetical protein
MQLRELRFVTLPIGKVKNSSRQNRADGHRHDRAALARRRGSGSIARSGESRAESLSPLAGLLVACRSKATSSDTCDVWPQQDLYC